MNQPTCAQALAAARILGLERLDAQLLLLHALGKPFEDRAWLLAHDTDELTEEVAQRFRALSLRRATGEPLAYIVGSKEFFGLLLQVDARVLVPRPDTETLVQWALDLLQTPGMTPVPQILDLGTGSGAIALAIAHSLQAAGRPARVVAMDASADALSVARENAQKLGLDVQFIESRWLDKVSGHFHLIASNPPYIASASRGSCASAAISPVPIRTWPRWRTSLWRRWQPEPMGWTTFGRLPNRHPGICCPAAGSCWSTVTTRPTACASCSPNMVFCSFKAAVIWQVSNAAQVGNGRVNSG
jgi:HemK-like putative methylase